MSFESELKTHLGDASITALVQDRVYPLTRPQDAAVPAVTYQQITLDPHMNLGGIDASLRQVRLQIDCWALTFDAAAALALAVRDRMNTAASNFRSVLLSGGLDDYESDTRLYRRMMEFNCWFHET